MKKIFTIGNIDAHKRYLTNKQAEDEYNRNKRVSMGFYSVVTFERYLGKNNIRIL